MVGIYGYLYKPERDLDPIHKYGTGTEQDSGSHFNGD